MNKCWVVADNLDISYPGSTKSTLCKFRNANLLTRKELSTDIAFFILKDRK